MAKNSSTSGWGEKPGKAQQSGAPGSKGNMDVTVREARAVNIGEFAKARSAEINTMMRKIKVLGSTSQASQSLPRHMRRRASSHNCKRLPQRLRDQYEREKAKERLVQTEKSKAKSSRSRRHRRRHCNLRQEFERRKRNNIWMETHLWHVKRFKMADLWGRRIPVQPSDKSARATYRAVAQHCLIQDISYHSVVEVCGPQDAILEALAHLTSQQTGLTFGAKAYISGSHHGEVVLYNKDQYPHNAICPVSYLWRALSSEARLDASQDRQLWMWVHPASYELVLGIVKEVCEQADNKIQVNGFLDDLVRFRLQGPLSHPILLDALEVAEVISMPTEVNSGASRVNAIATKSTEEPGSTYSSETWWEKFYANPETVQIHEEQRSRWHCLQAVQSSAELNPGCVMALTVRDPRILIPDKRTKVMVDPAKVKEPLPSAINNQSCSCVSPIWDADVREAVKTTQMPQHKLNKERSKQLVPGTKLNLGRQESRIPVLLLHNPGIKGRKGKGRQRILGYGAGWDIVIPSGWATAFWIALIYRGGRPGGVRESRSTALQQGVPHFPDDFIDTIAGKESAALVQKELMTKQSRKPPAKRPNYAKLGVPSPFSYEWVKLAHDWRKECENKQTAAEIVSTSNDDELGVLVVRDRSVLWELNKLLNDVEVKEGGKKNIKTKTELLEELNVQVVHVKQNWKRDAASIGLVDESSNKKRRTQSPDLSEKRTIEDHHCDFSTTEHDKSYSDITSASNAVTKFARLGLTDPKMYVCVQVSAVNKGAPGPLGLICLPTADDLSALAKDLMSGGPMEPIHAEYKLPRKPKKKTEDASNEAKMKGRILTDKLGLPNLKDLDLVHFCSRKVIGYITNGVHAFSTGKGFGVGFCCVLGLRELVEVKTRNQKAVVLVRDTGTLQYRFAYIEVVV